MHRDFSSSFKSLAFSFLAIIFFGLPSFGGKVVKTKGKSVYIKLSKSEAKKVSKGDTIYLTRKGKKKASVKVKKVKGRLVIATRKKGKPRKGYRTKLKKSKRSSDRSSYADGNVITEEGRPGRPTLSIGLLGGYTIATQEVNQGDQGTSNQSGSLLGFKAAIDYALFDEIGVRANIGTEMFSVEGEGTNFTTDNPGTIGSDITYLSIDILLRYRFMLTNSLFGYANGGIGILSPLSKESTALNPTSISTTSILILGGGVGFQVGDKTDIFVGADYYYFPSSEDVKTTGISAKFGFLYGF